MNTTRLWVIGSVTVMIIALLAGWFLGVEPNLAAAAKSDADRAAIETQNIAQQGILDTLAEENGNLAAIQEEYSELQLSIPASSNTAGFISGLDDLAARTGVQVIGFTVGASQAYTVPESATVVEAPPTDGATPSPSATAEPPAPATPVGSVAVTSPLITPQNFVGIAVGVDLKGTYGAVLSYLDGLQSGPRLVLVTGINSVADVDGGSGTVTAHIDAMIYVLKKPV